MIENLCARCERPQPDTAVVCATCTQNLTADLERAAGHADDAPAVVARQVRYGPGGGRGNEQPLPFDVRAAEDLWAVENTITTWVRAICEERGFDPATGTYVPPAESHAEPIAGASVPQGMARTRTSDLSGLPAACRFLAGQVDYVRHQPFATEAFDELDDACRMLRRLVDRPADRELVGPCDCGRVLYALRGREEVTCPDCELSWTVGELRALLRAQLEHRLVTAAEAGRLLGYLGTDRTQEQLRKLTTRWGERGEIPIRGQVWRKATPAEREAAREKGMAIAMVAVPTYRFGDVAVRLAQTPRRERRMAA